MEISKRVSSSSETREPEDGKCMKAGKLLKRLAKTKA
jgi:hypothetical protein